MSAPSFDPMRPSRFAFACLRLVTSRTRADAIVGDAIEGLSRGDAAPGSRWRLERMIWHYVIVEALAHTPHLVRSAGFVVRDAWRSLRAAPASTLFAVGVLTLAISASTVAFSVVDAVVLKPLPFPKPHRLSVVETASPPFNATAVAYHVYDRFRQVRSFSAIAGVARGRQLINGDAQQPVVTARTTASLFDVLGVPPYAGRVFDASHEVTGNDGLVVIAFGLWQQKFGGRLDAIGERLRLDDRDVTIVGVMPPGFTYPLSEGLEPVIWTPLVVDDDERSGEQPSRYMHVVARLAPGASFDSAYAETAAAFAAIRTPSGASLSGFRLSVRSLAASLTDTVSGWMLMVLAAVVLVWLVACANVANLLLTRAARRTRELALRASLGASRRHLIATMLAESLGLSLFAATLSLILAALAIDAVRAALPAGISRATDVAINVRVFVAAISAGVLTGVIFGVVPAAHALRQSLLTLLARSGTRTGTVRPRWRSAFLVSQVAFVSLLLVATMLFVVSFIRVTTADLGFDRRNLLQVQRGGLAGTVTDVTRTIATMPGVVAAGAYANGSAPLARAGGFGGGATGTRLKLPEWGPTMAGVPVLVLRVAPGYFHAAGMSVTEGRDFRPDELGRDDLIVLDTLAARALFGDRPAIGGTITIGAGDRATVTAVVDPIFDRGPESAPSAAAYMPTKAAVRGHLWLVRTSDNPLPLIPQIQTTLDQLAGGTGRPAVARPLEDAFRSITANRRFAAGLMTIFGVLALAIGAAGIYGVMLSIVAQQTREFGVRMALGATARTILSGVIGQAARHVLIGLAIGLPAGFLGSRFATSVFFGVRPTDASTYAIVGVVIFTVGMLAAALPARCAARVDPQLALRAD